MTSMNLRKKYMKYMNISVQAKRGFIFCSRHAGLTASEPQRASAGRDDHLSPEANDSARGMYLSLVSMHLTSEHYKLLFLPFLAYFK